MRTAPFGSVRQLVLKQKRHFVILFVRKMT